MNDGFARTVRLTLHLQRHGEEKAGKTKPHVRLLRLIDGQLIEIEVIREDQESIFFFSSLSLSSR